MPYQLEEPFFEEKGRITSQKELGGNRTQVTFSTDGLMKGTIEVTNTGDFVGASKDNMITLAQGQGVVTTKDGSEKASYTFLGVGKVTEQGKPEFLGSSLWSTESTGKLAFLNNVLSFFKAELDEMGNIASEERELK